VASFFAPDEDAVLVFQLSVSDGHVTVTAETSVVIDTYTGTRAALDGDFRREGTVAGVAARTLQRDGDELWALDARSYSSGSLTLLDVADPLAPVVLGSHALSSGSEGTVLAAGARTAFVSQAGVVSVIDFTSPATPSVLGAFPHANLSRAIAAGTRAYVLDTDSGRVLSFDVSDPSAPSLLGADDVYDAYGQGIALAGDTLYIGRSLVGLRAYDVADPTSVLAAGSYDFDGWHEDLAVSPGGTHVFIAARDDGVEVVDVSAAPTFTHAGSYDSGATFTDVAVDGTRLYAVAGTSVACLDVTDPTAPSLLGTFTHTRYVEDLAAAGDHVYLVDGAQLSVVDFGAPATPALVGSADVTYESASGLVLDGDLAYTIGYEGLVSIVDVSDPSAPSIEGTWASGRTGLGFAVAGDALVLPRGQTGLELVDVSVASAPVRAGRYSVPARASALALDGDRLYLGYRDSYSGGMQILDVTTPGSPVVLATLELGDVGTLGLGDDDLLLALAETDTSDTSLFVVDVADESAPTVVGSTASFYLRDAYGDIVRLGDHAYIGGDGLYVVDLTTPSAPTVSDDLGSSYDTNGVATDGSFLFTADDDIGEGAVVLNAVADPAAPAALVHAWLPETPLSVAPFGPIVYAAADDGTLYWVEMHPPALPDDAWSVAESGAIRAVTTRGDRAYVAYGINGFAVVDIGTPGSLTPLGATTTTGYFYSPRVAVSGTRAYLSTNTGVDVIDLADESAPSVVGSVTLAAPGFVAADGDIAIAAQANGGDLKVIDASDPEAPLVFNTSYLALDAVLENDVAYLASGGLRVVDLSNPSSPVELGYMRQPPRYGAESILQRVVKDGPVVFGLDSHQRLNVFDVQSGIPTHVGYVDHDAPFNVLLPAVGDGRFYLLHPDGAPYYLGFGIQAGSAVTVFDVERPAAPRALSRYAIPTSAALAVTGSEVLVGSGSELVAMEPLRDALSFTLASGTPAAAAELVYDVAWDDRYAGFDGELRCAVSGGSCAIESYSPSSSTAQVRWTLPAEPGDYELGVDAGHYHAFASRYTTVRLE
jgi:hypothetical protein